MQITRRHLLGTVGAALAAAPPVAALASPRMTAVATTAMIGDAVRAIGGDAIDLKVLMGPGIDPHSYRATRSDIVAMARADVVFANGLYLEAQMEDFLADLGRRTTVRAVAEAIPRDRLIGHAEYDGRFDPHVWMVPDLWRDAVNAVLETLSDVQPDLAPTFAANASAYLEDLSAVSAYAHDVLSTVPPESRVLVTAHDAFAYFGRAHGYEVMGVQGISTESEAGLNRIRDLIDVLVARRVKAVFVETSVSDRNLRALIEGAAAKGHDVRIGGQLFSDAMGTPGTYEATYVGMIDHNATVIAGALGGKVPERGMNGRLEAAT